MNRMHAIRKYYMWLCKGSAHEVKMCSMTDHPLWEWRLGRTPEKPKLSKPQAIRKTCLMCCETRDQVTICPFTDCPLWQFRTGKRETGPYLNEIENKTCREGKGTALKQKQVKTTCFRGRNR